MSELASDWALELSNLSKSFGGHFANRDLTFKVRRGSIHAIVGENGAGKSTCMKMVFGMTQPDAGQIKVFGKSVAIQSPKDAVLHRIGMVHQHFMLAGPMTALDNVLLTRANHSPFKILEREKLRAELVQLSLDTGFEVPWDQSVESLPVGIQQRIEILKLLVHRADLLILDEPTAVLNPSETEEFFNRLKNMVNQLGKTVILITHKLKEVMSVSDQVTVLRLGKVVSEKKTSETSVEELAQLMVGRKVRLAEGKSYDRKDSQKRADGAGLNCQDFSIGNSLKSLNFRVRPGEILGIAGVEGNGQSELINALARPRELLESLKSAKGGKERGLIKGRILLNGVTILSENIVLSTAEIRELGMGLVPEDRIRDGVLPGFDVVSNFALGLLQENEFLKRRTFFPELIWKKIRAATQAAISKFDVRPNRLDSFMGSLSGGNQQKLIVARELYRNPKFLIIAQPTRGVDVGAIEAIHAEILREREMGKAVLLISSELDEVLSLSDRVIVFYRGEIVGEFDRAFASEKNIGLCMSGQKKSGGVVK